MRHLTTSTFILTCFTFFVGIFLFAIIYENQNLVGATSFIDPRVLILFILAEPHFAFTIPLLYGYRKLFLQEKTQLILYPVLIIFISCILFFYSFELFSLIFLFANIYHVNRQSVGFYRMQTRANNLSFIVHEWLLHGFAISVIIISIFTPSLKSVAFYIALGLILVVGSIDYKFKRTNYESVNYISTIQGFLIFIPVLWFDDILMAFAVGISIHYIQYLFASLAVCRKSFKFPLLYIFLFIVSYSILSSSSLSGLITKEKISFVILIPTVLQLLHFYFDGFIWRRSNPFVNEVISRAV
jgi:hypothetical protein